MSIRLALGAAAITAASIASAPVWAGPPPQEKAPRCLDTTRIRNTTTPNDRTILFHMLDGTVYANHLRNHCTGLTFHGFAYVATPPHDICANMQSIRVIQDGTICMLGDFERVTPPERRP